MCSRRDKKTIAVARQVCRRWKNLIDQYPRPHFWLACLTLWLYHSQVEDDFSTNSKSFCEALERSKGSCLIIRVHVSLDTDMDNSWPDQWLAPHEATEYELFLQSLKKISEMQAYLVKLSVSPSVTIDPPVLKAVLAMLSRLNSANLLSSFEFKWSYGPMYEELRSSRKWFEAGARLGKCLEIMHTLTHLNISGFPITVMKVLPLPSSLSSLCIKYDENWNHVKTKENSLLSLLKALENCRTLTELLIDFRGVSSYGLCEGSILLDLPELLKLSLRGSNLNVPYYILSKSLFPKLKSLDLWFYGLHSHEVNREPKHTAYFLRDTRFLKNLKFRCQGDADFWDIYCSVARSLQNVQLDTLTLETTGSFSVSTFEQHTADSIKLRPRVLELSMGFTPFKQLLKILDLTMLEELIFRSRTWRKEIINLVGRIHLPNLTNFSSSIEGDKYARIFPLLCDSLVMENLRSLCFGEINLCWDNSTLQVRFPLISSQIINLEITPLLIHSKQHDVNGHPEEVRHILSHFTRVQMLKLTYTLSGPEWQDWPKFLEQSSVPQDKMILPALKKITINFWNDRWSLIKYSERADIISLFKSQFDRIANERASPLQAEIWYSTWPKFPHREELWSSNWPNSSGTNQPLRWM
jgi:hypothetical protein